jgi:UDP-N-acetylglucosamine diphosphorylase/glucosamine-1-phosphate N-acetyltransferase
MFFPHPGMQGIDPRMFHQQQTKQEESDEKEQNFVVIIMAGGEGKRMNSSLPKVLHPFLGEPMLVRIIKMAQNLSPRKIMVVTGKYHDLIKRVVEQKVSSHLIEYVQQKEPLGTGDAIKSCLPHLDSSSSVLILNGDMPAVQEELIAEFVNGCEEAGIMTMDLEDSTGYGRIVKDKKKNFRGIIEEKDCTEDERKIKEVNTGVYYFSAMILKFYIPKITNQNRQNEYYLTDIVKVILEHEDLDIHLFKVNKENQYQLMGVNTPEELKNIESIVSRL